MLLLRHSDHFEIPNFRAFCVNPDQRELAQHQLEKPVEVGERARQIDSIDVNSPHEDDAVMVVDYLTVRPRADGQVNTKANDWPKETIDA